MAGQRGVGYVIGANCRERFLNLDYPIRRTLRELGVQLAGLSALRRPYRMERSGPNFHVVMYCESGYGWCAVAGQSIRIAPGEVLIIPAGTTCAYGIDARQWGVFWLHLDADSGIGKALQVRSTVCRRAIHLPRVKAAMEGYLSESMSSSEVERRAAQAHAQLLFSYLEREFATEADPRISAQRRQLTQLWEEVDAQLRQPWSVSSLASRMHVSPVTLYRMCALQGALRPMEMVTRLRMERASAYLRDTDEPVKRVSVLVGYGNESAFSTAFKRFSGLPPGPFRQQFQPPLRRR
jgi:AraC family transcriptional regulator of arabinose operon